MTKTDIAIYRGLKEKFDPEVHVGFFITTDTGELLLGDQSLGQTISGWEINDGVLKLTLNTGKDIRVTFPEATETVKGLLSAADKAQLNALQANLESKVDKVAGKSLLADSEITKLAGLPNSTELTNSIATAKAAGDNAQSDLNAHKQNKSNPHEVTKAQVGLGNVTNDAQVKRSEMGVANGVATLDADGKVPAAQLPSYVDDIIDVYATYSKSDTGVLSNVTLYLDAAHTKLVTGEAGKIYQNIADGEPLYQFRWTGTIFSQTGASSLILGEVTGTAYDGAKGKANADNIAKIKGTSLSHIKDAAPITTAADKVSLNYECFEGNQYGAAGTDHTADIPAATTAKAGVMSAADKTKLENLNSKLVVADEEDVTAVDGKIKFKDRGTTNGMGYKILRLPENGILTQDMINQANTIYEIRYNFDLNGATITIPENCTLKFEGGKLSNGTLTLNDSNIQSSYSNILEGIVLLGTTSYIKSSYIEGAGFTKLNSVSSLQAETIEFDDDFTIDRGNNYSFKSKSLKFTNKVTLNTDLTSFIKDTSANILRIEGLTFDGNNHSCTFVLNLANSNNLSISNVRISNISAKKDDYCNAIITTKCTGTLTIDNIYIENISSIGNSTIGDAIGNISGIVISLCPNASAWVKNCYFNNLLNFSESGQEILEDVSCIYVSDSSTNETRPVHILNVHGYNFGKRLIKSDAGNLIIDGVSAENYKEGMSLAVVGLNNGHGDITYSNVIVNNINFKGYTRYVVATSVDNTSINNVNADMLETSDTLTLFYVDSDGCVINNSIATGSMIILELREDRSITVNSSRFILNKASYPRILLYKGNNKFFFNNCYFSIENNTSSFSMNGAIQSPIYTTFSSCRFNINYENPKEYLFTSSGDLDGRQLMYYAFSNSNFTVRSKMRALFGNLYNLQLADSELIWDIELENTVTGAAIKLNPTSKINISNVIITRNNPVSSLKAFHLGDSGMEDLTTQPLEIFLNNLNCEVSCSDKLYWKSEINSKVYRNFEVNLGTDAIGCSCYNTHNQKVTWNGERWIAEATSWKIIR